MHEKVLIIDAFNLFFRSYVVDPSLEPNGKPCGGCKGFLKSLQKLVRENRPNMIIVAWDGEGGSKRRKTMKKDYKEGRKPLQLNRNVPQNLTEEEQEENKRWQLAHLMEYLNEMPIIQLMFDNIEADDIIARIVTLTCLRGKYKIIVSSDKDFYQLCDKETIILRPVQKQVLNAPRIVEQFGIHPNNFALARAICGDKSDNIDGIRGAGLTTVVKRFPFWDREEPVTIEELFGYCDGIDSKIKLYKDIRENKPLIRENYQLMQLYSPRVSPQAAKLIKQTIEEFTPNFNRKNVISMMGKDGFGDYNWDALFQNFMSIVFASKGL